MSGLKRVSLMIAFFRNSLWVSRRSGERSSIVRCSWHAMSDEIAFGISALFVAMIEPWGKAKEAAVFGSAARR